MNRNRLLISTLICSLCSSVVAATSPAAQDHNSTRSNRGTVAAPVDAEDKFGKKTAVKIPNTALPAKGRNPQTGKEISTAKKQNKTGRNPQTGKEINIANKKD